MKVYFELIGISEYQIIIVTAYTKSASVVDSIWALLPKYYHHTCN